MQGLAQTAKDKKLRTADVQENQHREPRVNAAHSLSLSAQLCKATGLCGPASP